MKLRRKEEGEGVKEVAGEVEKIRASVGEENEELRKRYYHFLSFLRLIHLRKKRNGE